MGSHVRNAWYVAGWSTELEVATPFAISILGEPIVIFRSESGAVHALEDRCVHRLAPLSLGRCEGEQLRCMYHGLLYGPDGAVTEIPGQDLIPKDARVRSYPVVDRHSWLWVWMGDAAQADEALIPPAVGLDHPDYILGHGLLDYEAEAQLINDNLLDFSHLTYVHANSFGSGPDFAQRQPKIEVLDRGVRFSRWFANPAGTKRNPGDAPLEVYQTYEFLVPGVLLMWSGNYPDGSSARFGDTPPPRDEAISDVSFTSQAVTPTGAKTSRYFFSWGPHCEHGDEAKRDAMMAMAGQAFGEDKVMIEAQQKVIDRTADPRIMPTAHDKGVTLFNRLVERLAKQDGTPLPQETPACR